jgi:hypothetical protein
MRHGFYAAYDNWQDATAAVSEIESVKADNGDACQVVVHGSRRLRTDDLAGRETGVYRRLLTGILVGGGLGALSGAAMMATGVASSTAIGFIAVLGAVACGLGGAITGSAAPDPKLEKFAEQHKGKILITVTSPDLKSMERAETIAREHKAVVEQKLVEPAPAK